MDNNIFCIECGFELPGAVKFCKKCGIQIELSESIPDSKPKIETQTIKKKIVQAEDVARHQYYGRQKNK